MGPPPSHPADGIAREHRTIGMQASTESQRAFHRIGDALEVERDYVAFRIELAARPPDTLGIKTPAGDCIDLLLMARCRRGEIEIDAFGGREPIVVVRHRGYRLGQSCLNPFSVGHPSIYVGQSARWTGSSS